MIKVRHMAQVCRETMSAIDVHIHNMQPPTHWDDLNDRQRRLSCSIVNFILANPDATPEACHNAWMGEMKNAEGFQYGEFRDEHGKTHPDLVSYDRLLDGPRFAYALSIGVVRGLQSIQHRYENGVYPHQQAAIVPEGAFTPAEIDAIKAAGPSDVHFTGRNQSNQVVDQVVESTDEPATTDPATAE